MKSVFRLSSFISLENLFILMCFFQLRQEFRGNSLSRSLLTGVYKYRNVCMFCIFIVSAAVKASDCVIGQEEESYITTWDLNMGLNL